MKTKSAFLSLLIAAFALVSSCSGNKEEGGHEKHDAHEGDHSHASGATALESSGPQFEVETKFQNQLQSVFASYVDLKEAFVDSNVKRVQAEATETEEALAEVDMKLLTGAAHNDWMTYLKPMQTSLDEIQSATDIEAQRKSFSRLSDNLYKSIKAFGMDGKTAFYEYCPMAFNNDGGYWLSDEEKIRNPYFGEKMLTCGEVKEKLK